MPKYFCDYCDTYLTHDSPSVRKTHCAGRKHKENVKFYYEKWYEQNINKFRPPAPQMPRILPPGPQMSHLPPPNPQMTQLPPPGPHVAQIPPPGPQMSQIPPPIGFQSFNFPPPAMPRGLPLWPPPPMP